MKTNCPNCGAPIDEETHKCPYCNTPYFDMSFINFEDGKPFFLKIKYGDMYITQFVKPLFESKNYAIQHTFIPTFVPGDLRNGKSYNFYYEPEITIDISFRTIPHEGKLYTIEKESNNG